MIIHELTCKKIEKHNAVRNLKNNRVCNITFNKII